MWLPFSSARAGLVAVVSEVFPRACTEGTLLLGHHVFVSIRCACLLISSSALRLCDLDMGGGSLRDNPRPANSLSSSSSCSLHSLCLASLISSSSRVRELLLSYLSLLVDSRRSDLRPICLLDITKLPSLGVSSSVTLTPLVALPSSSELGELELPSSPELAWSLSRTARNRPDTHCCLI